MLLSMDGCLCHTRMVDNYGGRCGPVLVVDHKQPFAPFPSPQGPSILKLLARKDQALLVRGDTLLVLNLLLHILDGVRGLHIESNSLP